MSGCGLNTRSLYFLNSPAYTQSRERLKLSAGGWDLFQSCFYRRGDRREAVRVEARAADQRAVDVGLGHQLADVVGLDGPAVLDPEGRRVEGPGRDRPHVGVRLLGDLRRRGAAGADRPDRLVGDHELAAARGRHPGEAARELALEPRRRSGPPRAARATRRRRRSAGSRASSSRARLARHVVVGLAEQRAALAVADDRVAAAGRREHPRRDLAGEGALRASCTFCAAAAPGSGEPPRDGRSSAVKGGASDHLDVRRAAPTSGRRRSASVERLGARSCASSSWRRRSGGALSAPARRRPAACRPSTYLERGAAAGREVGDAVGDARAAATAAPASRRRRPP